MPTHRVSISYIVDEALPRLGLSWGLGETKKEIILSSTECRVRQGVRSGVHLGACIFYHGSLSHPSSLLLSVLMFCDESLYYPAHWFVPVLATQASSVSVREMAHPQMSQTENPLVVN